MPVIYFLLACPFFLWLGVALLWEPGVRAYWWLRGYRVVWEPTPYGKVMRRVKR